MKVEKRNLPFFPRTYKSELKFEMTHTLFNVLTVQNFCNLLATQQVKNKQIEILFTFEATHLQPQSFQTFLFSSFLYFTFLNDPSFFFFQGY